MGTTGDDPQIVTSNVRNPIFLSAFMLGWFSLSTAGPIPPSCASESPHFPNLQESEPGETREGHTEHAKPTSLSGPPSHIVVLGCTSPDSEMSHAEETLRSQGPYRMSTNAEAPLEEGVEWQVKEETHRAFATSGDLGRSWHLHQQANAQSSCQPMHNPLAQRELGGGGGTFGPFTPSLYRTRRPSPATSPCPPPSRV